MPRISSLQLAAAMDVTVQGIEQRLRACEALAPVGALQIEDVSGGCGSSFSIRVASPAFEGQSRLKQQRMVHKALGDFVPKVHALTIKCVVPDKE